MPLASLGEPTSPEPQALMVYSLRQSGRIVQEEARTRSAVGSLDDCNRVNGALQEALKPKRSLWGRITGRH